MWLVLNGRPVLPFNSHFSAFMVIFLSYAFFFLNVLLHYVKHFELPSCRKCAIQINFLPLPFNE